MAVIRMEHITKSFRDSKVLDDISLELEKGKIYGFKFICCIGMLEIYDLDMILLVALG